MYGDIKILVLLFNINLKLNIETQRGEVFSQFMADSLRLFLFQKLIKGKD